MLTLNRRRSPWLAPLLTLAAALAGCVSMTPGGLPPGTPIAEARNGVIKPNGEYALPGGGTRLEFAQGSFGKQTYMVDFDSKGLLVSSTQVLTEANFATIVPGTPAGEVLMRLGHPVHVIGVSRQQLRVWNYRYFGGDCVWFQVSISDVSQQVTAASMGTDPACDGPRGSRDS
jgi:hypothetical protein